MTNPVNNKAPFYFSSANAACDADNCVAHFPN